jgi:hypothetical protein
LFLRDGIDVILTDFTIIGYSRVVLVAQLEVPMLESSKTMASGLMTFKVPPKPEDHGEDPPTSVISPTSEKIPDQKLYDVQRMNSACEPAHWPSG